MLVALGGDEAEVLDLAFEQLVRRYGRAVADRTDGVATLTELGEYLLDTGEKALGGVRRGGRGLGGDDGAGFVVHCHDVGERSAGIDTDPNLPGFHASS